MSQHMVIFQNPDGHPGYNQFDSVEDAVVFVEKIRNDQGIDSIRIFELNEVKFELKPYYRVEIQALNPGAPARAEAKSAPAPSPAPPNAEPSAPSTDTAHKQGGPDSPFAPPAGASASTPEEGSTGPESASQVPVPPADQPESDDQQTRRGLFGR